MPDRTEQPVVILYEHPLLGEGIARCLLVETGVSATVAAARDLDAIRTVLACDPAVVIFELSRPLRDVDLTQLAPHAELIDVSCAMAQGPVRPAEAARLDGIVQAVRRHTGRPSTARTPNGAAPNGTAPNGTRAATAGACRTAEPEG